MPAWPSRLCQVSNAEVDREWVEGLEQDYKRQHEALLRERKEAEQQLDLGSAAANEASALSNGRLAMPDPPEEREKHLIILDTDSPLPSPPAFTDTSLPTPALGSSRVNTPLSIEEPKTLPLGAKRHAISEVFGEARGGKKARRT